MIKACALPLLCFLLAAAPIKAAERPTIVELFTSEGCSSCPPADALLTELAARPDVLALSFHVDYWDRLGWRDTFSSAQATARQQDYSRLLGTETVYTPQIVVDGSWEAVGSDRAAVEHILDKARRATGAVAVSLVPDHGQARIMVSPAAGAAGASVVLVGFDRSRTDTVERGENAGRTLTYVDVVRSIEEAGRLARGASEIRVPVTGHGDRMAAIVQRRDGRVLGVAVADRQPE
jgi:hypothetical protein